MFTALILFILSETCADLISAYFLWQLRRTSVANWFGVLMTALLIDSVCRLIAFHYRPIGVVTAMEYRFWLILGLTAKSAGCWAITFFLIRSLRGDETKTGTEKE